MAVPQPKQGAAAVTTFAGLTHLIAPPGEIADHKALITRLDALAETASDPEALRRQAVEAVGTFLEDGRARVRQGLVAQPHAGLRIARSFAHVTDGVIAALAHLAIEHLHPQPVRTKGQQMAIVAVGGYGRGEMAPFSDVDLLFVSPYKQTAWSESVIESILYCLWDLKLKVGQSVRSIEDCLRLAREDFTIRTTLLEQRFICGDREPFDTLDSQLWDYFDKTGPEFVEAKMAERDERHSRHGGSRYLLEPNVKESKGGLRDLQTLHWISKYLYHSGTAWDLVDMGVFEHDEVQRFADASKFIWAVRSHLHDLAGRAQEQLTFDRQVEIAERLGFRDRDGRMGVEHFMHAYFRHAKAVGDLTRIFSAALEAQHAKSPPALSFLLRALSFRTGSPDADGPFAVTEGRLTVRDEEAFLSDPINILRLFHDAGRMDAVIHPAALRLVTQNLELIDEDLRRNPVAVSLFLDMLCDAKHAEWLLRTMNETEVLGRFIPEFGRIVAMMQFNMYHHYTVDEHTIRTIGILNRIERLEAEDQHPVATEILKGNGINRRVLYTALLLHDIGKGDARDHSEFGAEIAETVCPRLGLDEAECETVIWLVRNHLLMSDTAQKRDINDPRTIDDFAGVVQSPQRLRLLIILTICDIRGVGPGVWNNWKAQLIRNLYWDTRDVLTGGAEMGTREHRVNAARRALVDVLEDRIPSSVKAELTRHYPHYWLGLDTATHTIFAELAAQMGTAPMTSRFLPDDANDATKACLYMSDHPGLFARMAGAFAIAGANVVDARSYTTNDGMATSVFWIQDRDGNAYAASRLPRLRRTIERTLKGEVIAATEIEERTRLRAREMQFTVPTRIVFDNEASDLFTVIEVNARDRLGLLHELTQTLADLNINIFSAIIATYGEHAVDVFYVKDLFGHKIRSKSKRAQIERRLIQAVDATTSPA